MTSLPGDGQRDRSQDCDMLGHREGPAHPAVAGHHAAPPLRLQGAGRTIAAAVGAVPDTTGAAQPVITFRTKFASV